MLEYRCGTLRAEIAELTASDGPSTLSTFNLSGFRGRFPQDWKKRWSQKCGAIDTLLDVECGFVEFFSASKASTPPTLFEAFGFMQALVIEQDAAFWLGRSMGFNKNGSNYPLLKFVRDIRDRTVGHPSYADKKDDPSSGMWSPKEISREVSEIVLYYNDELEIRQLKFKELYEINQKFLSEYMSELICWMRRVDAKS